MISTRKWCIFSVCLRIDTFSARRYTYMYMYISIYPSPLVFQQDGADGEVFALASAAHEELYDGLIDVLDHSWITQQAPRCDFYLGLAGLRNRVATRESGPAMCDRIYSIVGR